MSGVVCVDRGRRDGRASVSRHCRRAGDCRARAGRTGDVCRHSHRHRVARDTARRFHARRDSQRRTEGKVAAITRAWPRVAAGKRDRCLARAVATSSVGGDWRGWIQLGTGRGAGVAATDSDAPDGAERGARAHQSIACVDGECRRSDLRAEPGDLWREGLRGG